MITESNGQVRHPQRIKSMPTLTPSNCMKICTNDSKTVYTGSSLQKCTSCCRHYVANTIDSNEWVCPSCIYERCEILSNFKLISEFCFPPNGSIGGFTAFFHLYDTEFFHNRIYVRLLDYILTAWCGSFYRLLNKENCHCECKRIIIFPFKCWITNCHFSSFSLLVSLFPLLNCYYYTVSIQ